MKYEANKYIFDLYSTGGNIPAKQWEKYWEEFDEIHIVLVDAKIYTVVKRETMFDMGLDRGCMIDIIPHNTAEEARSRALEMATEIGAKRVTPEEFKAIEHQGEAQRIANAFTLAESMIARG